GSDISRDDSSPVEGLPLAAAAAAAEETADYDEADDRMDDIQEDIRERIWPRNRQVHKPKKRILTNTKLFYFLPTLPRPQPASQAASESRRHTSASQFLSDRSDCKLSYLTPWRN